MKRDETIELPALLDAWRRRQLDLASDDDTDERLPLVAVGLSAGLPAHSPSSTPSW